VLATNLHPVARGGLGCCLFHHGVRNELGQAIVDKLAIPPVGEQFDGLHHRLHTWQQHILGGHYNRVG